MLRMYITKMHGNGNDFIVIEDLENQYASREEEITKELCHRHFGVGGDGILIVRKSKKADIQMIIINSDGSYASMCGNGIRCFAKYVWDKNIVRKEKMSIETGDGVKEAYLDIENNSIKSVRIYMGKPDYTPSKVPVVSNEEVIDKAIKFGNKKYNITTMLMGVPHTVVLGKLEAINVEEGRNIEKDPMFPKGTNVNFCEVIDRNHIKVKTWERGAGATLACGTGSCASMEACHKLGLVNEEVHVELPGGHLFIELKDEGIYMSGPAVTVFEGEYTWL
jgi:diaminopimelate epimerase